MLQDEHVTRNDVRVPLQERLGVRQNGCLMMRHFHRRFPQTDEPQVLRKMQLLLLLLVQLEGKVVVVVLLPQKHQGASVRERVAALGEHLLHGVSLLPGDRQKRAACCVQQRFVLDERYEEGIRVLGERCYFIFVSSNQVQFVKWVATERVGEAVCFLEHVFMLTVVFFWRET